MKKKIARGICFILSVAMVICLFPCIRVNAASDPYYNEFGVTYEQLFMQYPQYLKSDVENSVTDVVIRQYTDVLNRHTEKDDYLPSYVYALKEKAGFSVELREILAAFNLAESTSEKLTMETIMLLMENICQSQTAASEIVSKVQDRFSVVKNIYDLSTSVGRENFIICIKTACKGLSDKQIDLIAKELFSSDLKNTLDSINNKLEVVDVITTLFAISELETEIIAIIKDAVPQNSGIKESIDLFLEKRGTPEAFIKAYVNDSILELVEKKLLSGSTVVDAALTILSSAASILYHGPSVSDIYRATALGGYVNGIYSAVANKRISFQQTTQIKKEDIEEYKVLYTAYVQSIRTTLESAMPLASKSQQGNLEHAMSICDILTYDKYIRMCMERLKSDIDAGIVPSSDATVTGLTVPTTLNQGSRFWIKGTISTKYSKILSVSFNVYDSSGEKKTGGTADVNGKNYTLDNSTVDALTEFNVLGPGNYTCELVATVDDGINCIKNTLYSGKLVVSAPSGGSDALVADSADFISRSDGVWLWPLPQGNRQLNDWAGCQGNTVCPFHGTQIWCAINSHGNGYNVNGGYVVPGHTGIDINAVSGTDVYATADGTLFCTGTNLYSRGIIAVVEHPLGNGWSYYSLYEHLSSAYTHLNKSVVRAGDVIAKTGNTDGSLNATGAHLHFSIYLGKSGMGEYYSLYPNNGDSLFGLECKPWVLSGGLIEGKVVTNPAKNSPMGSFSYFNDGGATQSSFKKHYGSVMYTTDKTQVSIGTSSMCNHQYAATKIPSTCTADGRITCVCSACGDSYSEIIPAPGHNYKGVSTPSTCISIGYITYTCSGCGDSYKQTDNVSWSDWSTKYPSGVNANLIEERTEYRFREKETTTSTSNTLNGWTLIGPVSIAGDYGKWSSWGDTPISATSPTKVETRTVWGYYYIQCSNCGAHMHGAGSCYTWAGGCGASTSINNWNEIWSTTSWNNSNLQDWHGTGKYYTYIDGELVFQWSEAGSKTQYRSCTKEVVNGYSFYRWGSWSDWSGSAYSKTDTREVESRKTYRYAQDAVENHSYSRGECIRCHKADPSYALTGESVERLAGSDRFDTAFKVADQMKAMLGVSKFDTIVVASGKDFADALSASYLAAVNKAPILLSYKSNQNRQVADYIRGNLAEGGLVYIIGGTSAVPVEMEDLLSGLRVKRLAGENRFETNLAVLKEAGIPAGEEILVCTGSDFADCLSAAAAGKPIMLVYKRLMDSQKAYIPTLNNRFCIIGGTNAVNSTVEDFINDYGATTRLAGNHRYETSVMVAQKYFGSPDGAVLAYARNFPDGLCGGVLAATAGMPLVLTDSKYYSYAADYTAEKGIRGGYVLGGEALISGKAAGAVLGG